MECPGGWACSHSACVPVPRMAAELQHTRARVHSAGAEDVRRKRALGISATTRTSKFPQGFVSFASLEAGRQAGRSICLFTYFALVHLLPPPAGIDCLFWISVPSVSSSLLPTGVDQHRWIRARRGVVRTDERRRGQSPCCVRRVLAREHFCLR